MRVMRGVVRKCASDRDGETLITYAVPLSDYDDAKEVGKQVGAVLWFMVLSPDEYADYVKQLKGTA